MSAEKATDTAKKELQIELRRELKENADKAAERDDVRHKKVSYMPL